MGAKRPGNKVDDDGEKVDAALAPSAADFFASMNIPGKGAKKFRWSRGEAAEAYVFLT